MATLDQPLQHIRGKYYLKHNPFPPATTGIDIRRELWIPSSWNSELTHLIELLKGGTGPKAFPIIGRYGSGKTYLMRWLEQFFLNEGILPYFFDNPGLQFYDLANMLMRKVGRYEFSKGLWELSKTYLYSGQPRLIELTFEEWLQSISSKQQRDKALGTLRQVFETNLELTEDEEIAYRLALLVTQTVVKPYFDYRDFVAGGKESLVAERQEPPYFRTLVRALLRVNNVSGIAFLIDEFEEVSSERRISKRKGHEYLATLHRLINLSEKEPLWLITAMTEEGATATEKLDPALWERYTSEGQYKFELKPLQTEDGKSLLVWWLDRARIDDSKKCTLFPFPDEIVSMLEQRLVLYPRRLVRFGFFVLQEAAQNQEEAPIRKEFVQQVMDKLFPEAKGGSSGNRPE